MRVRLLTPVQHDGKDLSEGQAVDLPQGAADALVKIGAAEPVAEPAKKAKG